MDARPVGALVDDVAVGAASVPDVRDRAARLWASTRELADDVALRVDHVDGHAVGLP